jgi:Protein of unknown function (DUF2934)
MAKRRARNPNDSMPTSPTELPMPPEPGDSADQAQQAEAPVTQAMASEPHEDDIRLRAYHRYLHRGGEHGRHFDDWVEAEQELRQKKSDR